MIKTIMTDILIIGAGGAAARAAMDAATTGVRVDMVDKGACGESGSSPRSLRGYAGIFDEHDSVELFFQDWMKTSGYISDGNLVRKAVTESRDAAEGLMRAGVTVPPAAFDALWQARLPDGGWFWARVRSMGLPD